MKIRIATADDLPAILDMGEKFHAFSEDPVPYCRESSEVSVRQVMGMGFVLLAETDRPVGMLGVVIAPIFFNFAHSFAQELMWWVEESERSTGAALRLIRAAEAEAKARGAVRIHMLRLAKSPEHVGRLYDRLGYRPGEVAHAKDL